MNSISSPHQQINYQIYTATTTTSSISLKRKRIMKSVHFAEKVIVLETYSSSEYDRSDIFSAPVLYKLNPTIQPPKLSLNIDNVPNLVRDSDQDEEEEGSFSSAENSPNTPPPCNTVSGASKSIADHYFQQQQQQGMKKKKRPLLTVNTTMCADPLFFTSLTTNYKNENTTTNSDFLVPVSAIDI